MPSILLDLTKNLSLFLQQTSNPVPNPAIYDIKLIKQKSNNVISIYIYKYHLKKRGLMSYEYYL